MKRLLVLLVFLCSCAAPQKMFFGAEVVGDYKKGPPEAVSCALVKGWDWSMYDSETTPDVPQCMCMIKAPMPGKVFMATHKRFKFCD